MKSTNDLPERVRQPYLTDLPFFGDLFTSITLSHKVKLRESSGVSAYIVLPLIYEFISQSNTIAQLLASSSYRKNYQIENWLYGENLNSFSLSS